MSVSALFAKTANLFLGDAGLWHRKTLVCKVTLAPCVRMRVGRWVNVGVCVGVCRCAATMGMTLNLTVWASRHRVVCAATWLVLHVTADGDGTSATGTNCTPGRGGSRCPTVSPARCVCRSMWMAGWFTSVRRGVGGELTHLGKPPQPVRLTVSLLCIDIVYGYMCIYPDIYS